MLIVRGVNVFPSQIETVLMRSSETEPQYQIVVDRGPSHMDELSVLVEVPESTVNDPHQNQQLRNKLAHELQSLLGISCDVRLAAPQEIARSEGKAVRVVDKRNN